MKKLAVIGIMVSCAMLSGCSYIGSFLICNFSGSEILVSYRTRTAMTSMQLFSTAPDIIQATLDGDEVVLGHDTLIPYEVKNGVTIKVPHGFALNTGDDVNAWMHEKEQYADLEEIVITQGTDTTRLTGRILSSFVRDLGSGKGLVIQ